MSWLPLRGPGDFEAPEFHDAPVFNDGRCSCGAPFYRPRPWWERCTECDERRERMSPEQRERLGIPAHYCKPTDEELNNDAD